MSPLISYRSYAKINLFLDVIGKRPDGFHNIETIFQTVSLADELTVSEQSTDITLDCPQEIEGSDNLVYRAALLLKEKTGCNRGAHMKLTKCIPIAAGLAGGSGNAAATLVALNQMWNLGLSQEDLMSLGLELGSDVPYCLVGGTAVATGRGEIIKPIKPLPETWFVLLHPGIEVSAGWVYNHDLLEYSSGKPIDGRTPYFSEAIAGIENEGSDAKLFNRMEAPVFAIYTELAKARQNLIKGGCLSAAMSGSGPTLFGICKDKEKAEKLAGWFTEYKTSVVKSVHCGVEKI